MRIFASITNVRLSFMYIYIVWLISCVLWTEIYCSLSACFLERILLFTVIALVLLFLLTPRALHLFMVL